MSPDEPTTQEREYLVTCPDGLQVMVRAYTEEEALAAAQNKIAVVRAWKIGEA